MAEDFRSDDGIRKSDEVIAAYRDLANLLDEAAERQEVTGEQVDPGLRKRSAILRIEILRRVSEFNERL